MSLALKKKERTIKDIRKEIFQAKPAGESYGRMSYALSSANLRRGKSFVRKHADNKAPTPI